MGEPGGLTPRQTQFVREYLVDLNATQAAIRAGYSPRTARRQASDLLAKPDIAAAVQAGQAARAERVQFSADEVLRELAILLRSDVRQFAVGNDGALMLAEGAPDDAWRAVASVKHKILEIPQKDGDPMFRREIEFRLWDKNAAIEKAMKHLGLLKDGAAGTINNTTNTVNIWRVAGREVRFR